MRTYNVAEIAELLQINKETVRRWIRSGELKSTQKSRKNGSVVDELDLFEFVQTKPKYRRRFSKKSAGKIPRGLLFL